MVHRIKGFIVEKSCKSLLYCYRIIFYYKYSCKKHKYFFLIFTLSSVFFQLATQYKRDLDFESTLESELGKSKYVSLDDKVANIHMDHLNAKTYIDNASYSYRLDGNNVDPEQENVELASETIRYLGLTNSISQEISRYKTVIK